MVEHEIMMLGGEWNQNVRLVGVKIDAAAISNSGGGSASGDEGRGFGGKENERNRDQMKENDVLRE